MKINWKTGSRSIKIKTRYYLEFLIPETMKLLGSTESKKTKDKNDEGLANLEVTLRCLINGVGGERLLIFNFFFWSPGAYEDPSPVY